jgi:hypothetical protein
MKLSVTLRNAGHGMDAPRPFFMSNLALVL